MSTEILPYDIITEEDIITACEIAGIDHKNEHDKKNLWKAIAAWDRMITAIYTDNVELFKNACNNWNDIKDRHDIIKANLTPPNEKIFEIEYPISKFSASGKFAYGSPSVERLQLLRQIRDHAQIWSGNKISSGGLFDKFHNSKNNEKRNNHLIPAWRTERTKLYPNLHPWEGLGTYPDAPQGYSTGQNFYLFVKEMGNKYEKFLKGKTRDDEEGKSGYWVSHFNSPNQISKNPVMDQGDTKQSSDSIFDFSEKNRCEVATDKEKISVIEGIVTELSGQQKSRSRKYIEPAKKRDNYTCQTCELMLSVNGKDILQVHHLSLLESEVVTTLDDLICLCPTCHYIAHTKKPPFTPEEIKQLLSGGS